MKRFGFTLLAFIFAVSMGGCSCLQKQAKEEAPPVQVAAPAKAPEPVKPAPPPPAPAPKKVRN